MPGNHRKRWEEKNNGGSAILWTYGKGKKSSESERLGEHVIRRKASIGRDGDPDHKRQGARELGGPRRRDAMIPLCNAPIGDEVKRQHVETRDGHQGEL